MFENGIKYLQIPSESRKGRARRTGELIWTTLARART